VAPWRKEKEGVDVDAPHGGGRRKERGPWCGGRRLRAAGNGPRPSGAGSAMPCKHGSPGELTGGPRPHCRVAASADRRAWAVQCRAAASADRRHSAEFE
jgi:hypothetical protein